MGILYATVGGRDVIGFGLHNFPRAEPAGENDTCGAVLYPVDPAARVILVTAPFVTAAVAVA